MEERLTCHEFQNGTCRFGSECRYLHVPKSQSSRRQGTTNARSSYVPTRNKPTDNPEEVQARSFYNGWKRTLKRAPNAPDTESISKFWKDALIILNAKEQKWKQQLPEDLDNDENHGFDHINILVTLKAGPGGTSIYLDLVMPFLEVLIHPALLDCLSVDSAVGGLYKYISGSHGSRGIPFFQQLANQLSSAKSDVTKTRLEVEHAFMTTLVALRELLRREKRATFHEDLPDLLDSLEQLHATFNAVRKPILFQVLGDKIKDIRGMLNGAVDRLQQKEANLGNGVSSLVITTGWPREVQYPHNRHSNDKIDFTEISILPTEDEIRSDHSDYLPSTDPNEPHFLSNPVARHLDTQFRLFRHDIFGELLDALGALMDSIERDLRVLGDSRLSLGDNIHAYVYPGSHINQIDFTSQRGSEVNISFQQPSPVLRLLKEPERREWWKTSARLKSGSLLSLLFLKGTKPSILFFSVSDRLFESKGLNKLCENPKSASVVANLLDPKLASTGALTNLHLNQVPCLMIEFPGLVLPTFLPILENLQRMAKENRLPFSNWIVPQHKSGADDTLPEIPPPLYARDPDFKFSLDQILIDESSQYLLGTNNSETYSKTIDDLEKYTTLDRGQCEGLVTALTREFSLIQGPPGTGKSYLGVQLMKVLLSCDDIGPVIVVCYTNHALDQFLEHLVNIGIRQVVRIGGQSKSSILRSKNLKVVSQIIARTRAEGFKLFKSHDALKKNEIASKLLMARLRDRHEELSWEEVKLLVAERYPEVIAQFSPVSKDEHEPVANDLFEEYMKGFVPKEWIRDSSRQEEDLETDSIESIIQEAGTTNVHQFSQKYKTRLLDMWAQELVNDNIQELFETVREADDQRQNIVDIYDEVDRRALETAAVIGVTTTGLARRISVLQHVKSKVVICEEAGEVMEPHLISALLPSCEQLIQIGDHQQLRPKIFNYNLSLESVQGERYQLDRSQFERLSTGSGGLKPPFPVAQLNMQRRMRPEISTLIKQTIYPRLRDHDQVKAYDSVVGMRSPVFWLDHKNVEDGWEMNADQKSKSNQWEVNMIHALVRHIVRQGVYKSSGIAVLTPYTGQLKKLSEKLRNDFEVVLSERDEETLIKEGFDETLSSSEETNSVPTETQSRRVKMIDMIRIATIDNFQGEESEVVIVSLVRSNTDQQVGFLKTVNRVNVLLSRAKHGMYLIGNSHTYEKVEIWNSVLGILRHQNAIGESLHLCCTRHPDQQISVSQPKEFAKLSPEGGCELPCADKLACGHQCTSKCHSEAMHRTFVCQEPCRRLFQPCNHECKGKICGVDCGACMAQLDNVKLPCGHHQDGVLCYQTESLQDVPCKFIMGKEVPECGHIIRVACSRDISDSFNCPAPCDSELSCGHRCPGSCSSCKKPKKKKKKEKDTIIHAECTAICGKPLSCCDHTCPWRCHTGPCSNVCHQDCEVECPHSKCASGCSKTCEPCIERCTWSCEHQGSCKLPCGAPCDRLPCNIRCSKLLECGHQCPSICGENCPQDLCQICCDREDVRVNSHSTKTYSEIDLDTTPIIALRCGHLFSVAYLDEVVCIDHVYHRNDSGDVAALRDTSSTISAFLPCCPECQRPFQRYFVRRYNRIVNKVLNDECALSFLKSENVSIQSLEIELQKFELGLLASRVTTLELLQLAKTLNGGDLDPKKRQEVWTTIYKRYVQYEILRKLISSAKARANESFQSSRIVQLEKAVSDVSDKSLSNLRPSLLERQASTPVQLTGLKAIHTTLIDELQILGELKSTETGATIKVPSPVERGRGFLQMCMAFTKDANDSRLLGQCVKAIILYASVVRPLEAYCRMCNEYSEEEMLYVEKAQTLVEHASKLTKQRFYNSDLLNGAIETLRVHLQKKWYEDVDSDEKSAVEAILKSAFEPGKNASLVGGLWYRCENGHMFPSESTEDEVLCMECGVKV